MKKEPEKITSITTILMLGANQLLLDKGWKMILRAYVIGSTGETVCARSYTNEESSSPEKVPEYVEAIVNLYRVSTSTRLEHVYIHEKENQIWAYVFFEQYVIVVLASEDEDITLLRRRIISMGRAIASVYGGLSRTWIGESSQISDLDQIVDRYVRLDSTTITDSILAVIELIIYTALEKYNIAYSGVFDAQGHLIRGNIPETHVRTIGTNLSQGTLKPSIDIVPLTIPVNGYEVQLLKVQYLTVVAAPYKDSSRLPAIKAVGEMAEALRDAISKLNTTSK